MDACIIPPFLDCIRRGGDVGPANIRFTSKRRMVLERLYNGHRKETEASRFLHPMIRHRKNGRFLVWSIESADFRADCTIDHQLVRKPEQSHREASMRDRQRVWIPVVLMALLGMFFEAWAGEPLKTGIDFCINGTSRISCPSPGRPFYGQDGTYRMGRARSYAKLGAGGVVLPDSSISWLMVLDETTGLVWEVKTEANKADVHPWSVANSYCDTLSLGGYSDWRLPTMRELSTLADIGLAFPGPTIDTGFFPHCRGSWYWSSTPYVGNTDYAWSMVFFDGYANYNNLYVNLHVRAVRAGPPEGLGRFDDNGDGTVTDPATGLSWQKATMRKGPTESFTWEEALDACENLGLAGYMDWRLPNRNELQSLARYWRNTPAIDPDQFPDTLDEPYWTSSPYTGLATAAWFIGFGDGNMGGKTVEAKFRVRAVRGGKGQGFYSPPDKIILLHD
ncbi:MAG: DUF1566 domain-containing protein [Deltaproteobacteria bacterium]|nr:DUF1566 domain-containing protein [Deltaproteobacteria bacterium]